MRIDWPGERDDGTDSPEEIKRQDADLPVSPRQPAKQAETAAEYRATVDAEYRSYAIDKGCERVEEIEENVVSPAMRRIEAEDPDRRLVGGLTGHNHKRDTVESLARLPGSGRRSQRLGGDRHIERLQIPG